MRRIIEVNGEAISKALGLEVIELEPMEFECEMTAGGYINEEVYRERRIAMLENNPMRNEKSREKMRRTKLEKFASGEQKPSVFSEETRKRLSESKKGDNNPLRKNPELTATAKPVIVTFEDGSTKQYPYAKKMCEDLGISYAMVKHCIRYNKGSKKFSITSIEQI